MSSAEGPGKEGGGQGRWRGNPGIPFHAFLAVGTLAKCIVVLCLVTGKNAEESGAALHN
jgi:hypothetical protein